MGLFTMADAPKKRTFRKFSFRGHDLDSLMDMSDEAVTALFNARQRRKRSRHGVTRKSKGLLKRVRKAIADCPQFEKPATVKTHLRGQIIMPGMSHSVLGEFSITYKPVKHGRPGIGATNSSRFVPLK